MSNLLLTSRRSFLGGLLSALAAPAIVHAGNIMPVRNFLILPEPTFDSFDKLMSPDMQYQWMSSGGSLPPSLMSLTTSGGAVWVPVPASRYKSMFQSNGETIQVGGMVLMERPVAACEAARAQEIKAAHKMVGGWADQCVVNGFEGGVRYTQPTTVDFRRISYGEIV